MLGFEEKIPRPQPAPKQPTQVQAKRAPAAEQAHVDKTLKDYAKGNNINTNRYASAPTNNSIPTVAEKDEAGKENKIGLRFLDPTKTEKLLAKKQGKAKHLAKTTATTKLAAQKINESEQAQDKPAAEQHSDSQEGQVAGFADQNVTNKSKEDGKKVLGNAIDAVMPKKIEDLTTFKKEGKGKNIGDAVSGQVKGDVGSVKNSFAGMGATPAPAPAAKGAPLPQPEAATHVEPLQLGTGVIPGIEPAHLDTKDYLKQNDALLKQEELPQEHLDMVDTGDLAEANKERAQLKADTVAEPKAVKEASAAEHKQLNSDLHKEETDARNSMSKHRNGGLKDTGEKQQTTKTKLEKEREAVAKKINDKFTACQTSILGKLDKLEKDSLAKFDQGQAKATTDFEDKVNKDIEAFKDRRYSGTLGDLKWVKDLLFGIDEFPEVKNAFTNARNKFETDIDALLVTITADNNKVIAECKKELADTKKEIADYVRTLKGSLKDVGQQAMKDVNDKLKKLDEEIDKRKEKLQQQLTDKRAAAMKAIDDKIAKMKEKLSGALSIIDKLLLEALKKFFKWALEKLGIDAEGFFNTLAKMGAAIKAMFKSPGNFFSNLIASVKGAITDFKTNFTTYLTGALFDWLTGAVGSIITLPKVFDVKGVLSVIMQLAGISWAFIRSKLVNIFGEQKIAYAEKTVDVVKRFVTDGIMGIWDWIKDSAQSMMSTVIEAMKGWLLTKLVVSFAEWIASLLIPGGAILRLVQGIYKLVMWFVDNIQRIIRWVNAVLDSLGNIAIGAVGAATGFIVNAMKMIIPVILDFFAKLLNIGGIVDAVKNIINKIVGPIHKAIDKMVDWLKGVLNKVVDKVKGVFGKKEEKKKDDGNVDPEKQKALHIAIEESENLLVDDELSEEEVAEKLPEIKKKYGLVELKLVIDQDGTEEDLVHVHGEINPSEDSHRIKKRKKVKVGTLIQIIENGKWSEYSLKVTKVINQHQFNAQAKKQAEIVFKNKELDIVWRKYNPYKVGEAWEAIKDGDSWTNYADARQVLNYRKHKQFQNPSAKDWHHIIEQSNKTNTEHSVVNLAIVDENLNRGSFKTYFDKPQDGTNGVPLRKWLESQSKEEAKKWGYRAIEDASKSVVMKDEGRGKYQEIE
jgi:hypothetical protein